MGAGNKAIKQDSLPFTPTPSASIDGRTKQESVSTEMRIFRLVFPVFAFLLVTALVSTTLVHAQVGTLQINKAVYGKEGLGKDVTQRLQKMIKDNTLDIKVTNISMGGDPNKGADKTLKVDYTFRGKRLQVVVKEGDRLRLP
jgi:hypothetical protein